MRWHSVFAASDMMMLCVAGSMTAAHALLQDEQSAYAQLTVRIRALHKFAAYSGKGELKAGSPGKEFPVQDVWILERAFKKGPTSRWRIAGVLAFGCTDQPADFTCLGIGFPPTFQASS